MKIGRNAPCPCGSGKKYKKCCGNNKVVEFPAHIVNDELDQYFIRFQEYITTHYPYIRHSRQKNKKLEGELHNFFLTFQKAVLDRQAGSETIMEEYINHVKDSAVRPATKESLESWVNPAAGLFTIEKFTSNEVLQVRNELSGESYPVKRSSIPTNDLEDTPHCFGVLLKWGRVYQFMPVGLPEEENFFYAFLNRFKEQYNQSGTEQTADDYFAATFFQQFQAFVNREGQENPVDVWEGDPQEKAVLELLDDKLEVDAKESSPYNRLKGFWISYCEQKTPTIRKPAVFAATLEYTYRATSYFEMDHAPVTKKSIAQKYGVSPNSISRRFDEMKGHLLEMDEKGGENTSSYGSHPSQQVTAES